MHPVDRMDRGTKGMSLLQTHCRGRMVITTLSIGAKMRIEMIRKQTPQNM